MRSVLEFAFPHPLKELQVFFDGSMAVGTLPAGLGEGSAVIADFLGAQAVDVRRSVLDQMNTVLVELLEVVRRVKQPVVPIKAQPLHILLDGFLEFDRFLDRIRVVKPKIAKAVVLGCHAKVQANRLRMADVQISVGLGRETRMHTSPVPVRLQVLGDPCSNEVQ